MMFEAFLKISAIAACLSVAACTESKPSEETSREKDLSRLLPKEDTVKSAPIERHTPIITHDNLKVEGNSNLDESMIQSIEVKFEPYVWFGDFAAPTLDTVTKAPLDFSSNKEAKHYITSIKYGYKEEFVQFGGHYILVYWGCGSPCYNGVIVDRQTGKIYDLPESLIGYECLGNSLMLIVNPPDELGYYDINSEFFLVPQLYVFNENRKTFEMLKTKGRTR